MKYSHHCSSINCSHCSAINNLKQFQLNKETKIINSCSPFAYKLICKKRGGQLIRLIKENLHIWSLDRYIAIFDQCIKNDLHNVFIFMLDHFQKYDMIKYIGNTNNYNNDITTIMWWLSRRDCYSASVMEYFFKDRFQLKSSVNFIKHYNRILFYYLTNSENSLNSENLLKYIFSHTISQLYPNILPTSKFGNCYDIPIKYSVHYIKYLTSNEIVYKHKICPTEGYDKMLRVILHTHKTLFSDDRIQLLQYILDELCYKCPLLHKYEKQLRSRITNKI
jgi:hypothetical protein